MKKLSLILFCASQVFAAERTIDSFNTNGAPPGYATIPVADPPQMVNNQATLNSPFTVCGVGTLNACRKMTASRTGFGLTTSNGLPNAIWNYMIPFYVLLKSDGFALGNADLEYTFANPIYVPASQKLYFQTALTIVPNDSQPSRSYYCVTATFTGRGANSQAFEDTICDYAPLSPNVPVSPLFGREIPIAAFLDGSSVGVVYLTKLKFRFNFTASSQRFVLRNLKLID